MVLVGLGSLLGASWADLEASWGFLGPPGTVLGLLEVILDPLGAVLVLVGAVLSPLPSPSGLVGAKAGSPFISFFRL